MLEHELIPETPVLTVVVVVLSGREYLVRCLTALGNQVNAPPIEIIVPCDDRLSDVSLLCTHFPQVDFLCIEGRQTYAELRALGCHKARGSIVALTEDHCSPTPDWCARIIESHRMPHAAVGGAVMSEPDKALNWAVYLADYGRYMNPVPEGLSCCLTDCNVSYKYSALAAIADVWADEFHEPIVNGTLLAQGGSLWLSPQIIVHEHRCVSFRSIMRERYAMGRLFGSNRVAAASKVQRMLYAILCIALPPLLLGRIARNVVSKHCYIEASMRAIPAAIAVTTIWVWGECVGYVTAQPPRSLMPSKRNREAQTRLGQEADTDLQGA